MKSLKEYAMNIPDQDYHNYPAWSYSKIATYAREGFGSLSTLHEPTKSTASMEFGSLFDSMITKGNKTLDEYAVMDMSVPDAERKALDYISTCTNESFEDLSPEYIYNRCQECGYQPRWKMDTVYGKLLSYKDYYDIKKSGKKLVSREDWEDAKEMYGAFRNSKVLKDIFKTKNENGVEYLYQLQFVTDVELGNGKTVPIKMMADLTIVDHNDKTVQIVDLKTSAMPGFDFKENFLKFRYDIQATLYPYILSLILKGIPEYEDYTLKPFMFADISRSDKVPVTYYYPQDDPSQIDGLCYESNGKVYQYRGWMSLLEEILAYEEAKAVVPNYISLDKPNNLLDILSR